MLATCSTSAGFAMRRLERDAVGFAEDELKKKYRMVRAATAVRKRREGIEIVCWDESDMASVEIKDTVGSVTAVDVLKES